jgi:hypothetical protein
MKIINLEGIDVISVIDMYVEITMRSGAKVSKQCESNKAAVFFAKKLKESFNSIEI